MRKEFFETFPIKWESGELHEKKLESSSKNLPEIYPEFTQNLPKTYQKLIKYTTQKYFGYVTKIFG